MKRKERKKQIKTQDAEPGEYALRKPKKKNDGRKRIQTIKTNTAEKSKPEKIMNRKANRKETKSKEQKKKSKKETPRNEKQTRQKILEITPQARNVSQHNNKYTSMARMGKHGRKNNKKEKEN